MFNKSYSNNFGASTRMLRGVVVDNNDPKKMGRVKVRITELHGQSQQTSNYNYEITSGEQKNSSGSISDEDCLWCEVMQPITFSGYAPKPKNEGKEIKSAKLSGTSDNSETYKDYQFNNEKMPGIGQNTCIPIDTWVFVQLMFGNEQSPIVVGTCASKGEYNELCTPGTPRVYMDSNGNIEEWSLENNSITWRHNSGSQMRFKDDNMYSDVVGNKYTSVQGEFTTHTDSNENHRVGANYDVKVSGEHTRLVEGHEKYTINSGQEIAVESGQKTSVNGGQSTKVSGGKKVETDTTEMTSSGTTIIKGAGATAKFSGGMIYLN